MQAFRIAAIAAFALVYATSIHAQNDPVIRTGGKGDSVAVTSFIFTVASPSGNSPALSTVPDSTDCVLSQRGKATSVPGCFFQNNIITLQGKGVTISRLVFVVDNAEYTGVLTCGTDTFLGGTGPFAACTVQPVADGTFSVVTFSNGSIPPGGDFSMGMRGFNSNASFAGIALPSRSSDTAEIYVFPSPSGANSDRQSAGIDASRFVGSQTFPIRTLSDFRCDRSAFGSSSFAAFSSTAWSAAWSSSNRPISGGVLGPSPITFEACPASGWRIT